MKPDASRLRLLKGRRNPPRALGGCVCLIAAGWFCSRFFAQGAWGGRGVGGWAEG